MLAAMGGHMEAWRVLAYIVSKKLIPVGNNFQRCAKYLADYGSWLQIWKCKRKERNNMGKMKGRRLVKTRNSRMDTVEAMDLRVGCISSCSKNCNNCSGGGSWSAKEGYNRLYAVARDY